MLDHRRGFAHESLRLNVFYSRLGAGVWQLGGELKYGVALRGATLPT